MVGMPGLPVTATASSGLPVTLTSQTPSVCSVAGSFITALAQGSCTIAANQPGKATFAAATPVAQTFSIRRTLPAGSLRGVSPAQPGAAPNSVTAMDLNNDGILDLVTVNTASNNISLLLGDGKGGFLPAPGSPVPAGNAPSNLAAGDFNGDGFVDLAVTSGGSSSVTILLSNAAGGWVPASPVPVSTGAGSIPIAITAGDFNNDGLLDLAVADRANNVVILLLGNGTGSFVASKTSPISLNGGLGPVSILAADFDLDGNLDLATTNQVNGTLSILLGNGTGAFTSAPGSTIRTGAQPLSLTVADFNADGVPDVAVAAYAANAVNILIGKGDGTFIPTAGSPLAAVAPWAVTAGDLNGDDKMDLIVASAGDGILLWLGDGAGTFATYAPKPFAGIANPVSALVGDFNNDFVLDLAVIAYGSSTINILPGGIALTIADLSTTSSTTIPYGQSVPLTLKVSGGPATFIPLGGTAEFLDNGTSMGFAAQNVSPYTFTAKNLTGGSHIFAARYSGIAQALGSVNALLPIQVTGAPASVVSAVSPISAVAGTGDLTLRVTGTGFVSTSQVYCNKTALTTTYASPTQLTATLPALLLAAAGSATVSVLNPGAPTSNTVPFTIIPFAIASLSPSSATVGAASFQLCATGTGFLTGGVLTWNGALLSTKSLTATQLCSLVTADLVASPTKAFVIAMNPDGNSSGSVAFPVSPPIPAITPGGVVPIYSSTPVIQPGSWISIYGTNLATGTSLWKGDFPTTLGGVSVAVNNKPAYLWSVTPGQINAQAPDDTATGKVTVVVSNTLGSATATVTLAPYAPSFSLLPGSLYAAGVIATPDGSGAYGGGTYDIMGPIGAFAFKTRPVRPGETLVLFGVGFGPQKPAVSAGAAFSGAAPLTGTLTVKIGGLPAKVLFAGITSAGLCQINLVVPAVTAGDQDLLATVGGSSTPAGVVISAKN